MSNKKTILFFILLFLAVESFSGANTMDTPRRLLVPMGGGYSDVYGGFIQSILSNQKNGQINIAILPMAYSTNPLSITEGERQTNIKDAERTMQNRKSCSPRKPLFRESWISKADSVCSMSTLSRAFCRIIAGDVFFNRIQPPRPAHSGFE